MLITYGYGEDSYKEDTSDLHWGKYDSPMAKYISDRVQADGDFGDEDWTSPYDSEGFARYGRRILSWDSQGFVSCDTFPTVDDAAARFAKALDDMREPCETCDELLMPDDDEHRCDEDGPLRHKVVAIVGSRVAAWFVQSHYESAGKVVATMIGDDRPETFDVLDVETIGEGDYCHDCGALDCHWHRVDEDD